MCVQMKFFKVIKCGSRSRVGVYFYPDFTTVIVGLWEDHLLLQVIINYISLQFGDSSKRWLLVAISINESWPFECSSEDDDYLIIICGIMRINSLSPYSGSSFQPCSCLLL